MNRFYEHNIICYRWMEKIQKAPARISRTGAFYAVICRSLAKYGRRLKITVKEPGLSIGSDSQI